MPYIYIYIYIYYAMELVFFVKGGHVIGLLNGNVQ